MRQAAKYVKMEERERKQIGIKGKKRRQGMEERKKEAGTEGKREREGPIIIKTAFQ